jgi:hypothetical protein
MSGQAFSAQVVKAITLKCHSIFASSLITYFIHNYFYNIIEAYNQGKYPLSVVSVITHLYQVCIRRQMRKKLMFTRQQIQQIKD